MGDAAKEQIKLTANYMNGLALIFAGAGSLTAGLNIVNRDGGSLGLAIVAALTGLIFSILLHLLALSHLRRLP